LFLYANALAANHQYTRAKNIFVVVAQDNNSRYKKEAAFYEALMLLKLGKATEAKSIFSKIASKTQDIHIILKSQEDH
jgi:TolA-binding protein